MSARTLKRHGFTLVEILIVVVILGILAAIVIPQFTSASESARASSLKTQLQTIRSQLELYQVQHLGDYPTLAQLTTVVDGDGKHTWENLTRTTDNAGALDPAVTGTAGYDNGPYLQKPPVNPFTAQGNGTQITAMAAGAAAAADATFGWAYDASRGQVKAIVEDDKARDLELVPASYVLGSGDNQDFITY